jgi:hypothetical protein
MTKSNVRDDQETLAECRFGSIAEVRALLIENSHIDIATVENAVNRELEQSTPKLDRLQGLARALVALLPSSYSAVRRLLLAGAPKAVYEVHFSIFGALDRSLFNDLEQDGIEYAIVDYLSAVKSTSSYAAWKAGLVLGEDWISPQSELELKKLMKSARFPAGRLGAINGYRFILQRRRTLTTEELAPLLAAASRDKSSKVRDDAQFHIKRLRGLQSGTLQQPEPSLDAGQLPST